MKRIVLGLILFSFLIINNSFSQQKPVLFGFKVAPNIGWMKSNTKGYENPGSEIGFSWGFIADFHLMENYDIVSGLNVLNLNSALQYSELYNVFGFGELEGELTRKYVLEYLEVPLILKMKTNEFGKKFFYGKVGMSTGFLISAKVKDSFQAEESGLSKDEHNYYDQLKFARYSVILGVGAEFNIGGSTTITTGFTFSNGINDVLKDTNDLDQTLKQNAINNYFNFNLGILF